MNCSLPGSPVHWILQAMILERAAISSSRACSQPRDQTHVSCGPYIGRRTLSFWPPGRPCLLSSSSRKPSLNLNTQLLPRNLKAQVLQGTAPPLSCSSVEDNEASELQFPTFLAPGTNSMEDNFSRDRGGGGKGLGTIQAHYIYCALHFYYYYISSTSDHQGLDPEVGDSCSTG